MNKYKVLTYSVILLSTFISLGLGIDVLAKKYIETPQSETVALSTVSETKEAKSLGVISKVNTETGENKNICEFVGDKRCVTYASEVVSEETEYVKPEIKAPEKTEEEKEQERKAEQEKQAALLAEETPEIGTKEVDTTPAPQLKPEPKPEVPVNYVGNAKEFEDLIRQRCQQVGCNSTQVIRVMYCESGGRSNAKNPYSSASGLFQYMPPTYLSFSSMAGFPGADIWNPYDQINVTTWAFANGYARHWVCK
jgi:hypothetical protein